MATPESTRLPLRERLHEIIFEADTPAGKLFDVALLVCISISVLAVILESVASISADYGRQLRALEWVFTGLFSIEYALRLYSVQRPLRYATSFFGIVDLLAVVPTYLSILFPGAQSLLVVRILRMLRVFRVFKMARYLKEASVLLGAVRSGGRKVMVFLGTVVALIVIIGSLMYLIEGGSPGFENIPAGIYWAVVTLTTVGYGDIVPATALGKACAAVVMITGFAIIAVPFGIMTAELTARIGRPVSTQACRECSLEGHEPDAKHCKHCGAEL